MRRRLNAFDWVALTLLIIGGINWGLIGLFQYDLVAAIFGGSASVVSRIIYTLVGISAVFVGVDAFSFEKHPAGEGFRAHMAS